MSNEAVSSPAPSPLRLLHDQWLIIMNKNILNKEVVEIALDWLTCHPAYESQAFWRQAVGPDNRTPLANLLKSTPHETYVLPIMTKFMAHTVSREDISDQFNRPGDDGKVFLHLLWDYRKKAQQKTSSYGGEPTNLKELCEQWVQVLPLTDKNHWLWLDKEDDLPGEGLRRALMLILQDKPYPSLATMANAGLTALNDVYPAKPKATHSSKSPWKSALRASKVQALVTLGHKIDEPVQVGQLQVPAWEWLMINASARAAGSRELIKIVSETMEQQGVSGFSDWKDNRNKLYVEWNILNPETRRATVGYVAKVMDFTNEDGSPRFDISGASPMDYALRYRQDLFPMFASKAAQMSKEDFTSRFMQPDRAGAPALLRYYSTANEDNLPTLRELLEQHDCWQDPIDMIRGCGGLFEWEENTMAGWIHGTDVSFLYSVSTAKIPPQHLADPEVFFGDNKQQQKWVSWWEENLPNWKFARNMMIKESPYSIRSANPLDSLPQARFATLAIKQMEMFLANGTTQSWARGLDPCLREILHVAACYLTTGLPVNQQTKAPQWFVGLEKFSAEAKALPKETGRFANPPRWEGVELSRNPPNSVSPAVLDWISGPDSQSILMTLDARADFPGRTYNSVAAKEERESWETWLKRAKLMNTAGMAQRPGPMEVQSPEKSSTTSHQPRM